MNCYGDSATTTGAGAGGTGCVLALTGSGPAQWIGYVLLALTAVFMGVLLIQLVRRGTRIPFLRKYFPRTDVTIPPVSPTN